MASILDALEREWDHVTHPHASQAPAATPATVEAAAPAAPPMEEPVSLSTDLHGLADRLDKVGEESVTKLEAVVASPIGSAGFALLHQITGLNIDPKQIEAALGGLQALLLAYAPAAAPADPAQAAQAAPAA